MIPYVFMVKFGKLLLNYQGDSNEYPQHVFMEKYGKLSLNYFLVGIKRP